MDGSNSTNHWIQNFTSRIASYFETNKNENPVFEYRIMEKHEDEESDEWIEAADSESRAVIGDDDRVIADRISIRLARTRGLKQNVNPRSSDFGRRRLPTAAHALESSAASASTPATTPTSSRSILRGNARPPPRWSILPATFRGRNSSTISAALKSSKQIQPSDVSNLL